MIILEEKTKSNVKQLDLFKDKDRWPRKPYCSNELSQGIYPRTLQSAITKKYIQANPPHLRIWSIYDLDYSGAGCAWEDQNLPEPNWAAVNKENGHAHLVYGLSAPVLVDSPDARQAPIRYLHAIEQAFKNKLQADSGYSGLITKNPAHPQWAVLRGHHGYYDLQHLSEYVDLALQKYKLDLTVKVEEVGLGRNITLFDFLRKWAYKEVRQYKGQGLQGWNAWMMNCNLKALDRNGNFANPLHEKEAWHIARSVARWTYQRFDIEASDKRFSELQAHRGSKGGIAKGLANEDKRTSAKLMRTQSMSYQQIANELNVSRRSVINWCK